MSEDRTRSFSREFKLAAVKRIEAGENVSALARELLVKREILYRWRDAHRVGGPEALRQRGRTSAAEAEARWQIAELQRLAGRQQLELDFFRKALRLFEDSTQPVEGPDASASSPSSRR